MSKKKKNRNDFVDSKGVSFDTFTEGNIDPYLAKLYPDTPDSQLSDFLEEDDDQELIDTLESLIFPNDESYDMTIKTDRELDYMSDNNSSDMIVDVNYDSKEERSEELVDPVFGTTMHLTYNDNMDITGVLVDDGLSKIWVPISTINTEMEINEIYIYKLYNILKFIITDRMKPVALFTKEEMLNTFKYLKSYNDLQYSFVKFKCNPEKIYYAVYDNGPLSNDLEIIFNDIRDDFSDFTLLSTMELLYNTIDSAGFSGQLNNMMDIGDGMFIDSMMNSHLLNHKDVISNKIFADADTIMGNDVYGSLEELESSICVDEYPQYLGDEAKYCKIIRDIIDNNQDDNSQNSSDIEYDEEYDEEYYDDEYDEESEPVQVEFDYRYGDPLNVSEESEGASNDNEPFQTDDPSSTEEYTENSDDAGKDDESPSGESVDDSSESGTTIITARTVRSRDDAIEYREEKEEEKEELQEFRHDETDENWEEEAEELQEFGHDESSWEESKKTIEEKEESILDIENPDEVAIDIDDDESDDMTIPVYKG